MKNILASDMTKKAYLDMMANGLSTMESAIQNANNAIKKEDYSEAQAQMNLYEVFLGSVNDTMKKFEKMFPITSNEEAIAV